MKVLMMKAAISLILFSVFLGATLMLGGCGQSGPLYLPKDTPPAQTQTQQTDKNSPATSKDAATSSNKDLKATEPSKADQPDATNEPEQQAPEGNRNDQPLSSS